MKKLIVVLLLLLSVTNSWGAIYCQSPLASGYIPKPTLSAAATATDCANKTVVVTSTLSAAMSNISSATLHAWPTDRKLKVEKGGSIANTTKFVVNGPFDAGLYQVFSGAGMVTFGSGAIKEAYPEWWGVTGTADEVAIQKAVDSYGLTRLTKTDYTITSPVYLKSSHKRIVGNGIDLTTVTFSNAGGGTAFAGTVAGTGVITGCELSGFSIFGNASKVVDVTTFSSSTFDLSVKTTRANSYCYYLKGNGAGSAPYYNRISGEVYGNGAADTQTGFAFLPGGGGFSADGPNGNIIGPIKHAQSLQIFADLVEGDGNVFHDLILESIGDVYFRLNNVASYADTGTSTGSNTPVALNNTGKSWTTNAYTGYAVKITSGTGIGQARRILTNTATQLNLVTPWAIVPDATSTYVIAKGSASNNKVNNVRSEGLASENPDFISALLGAYGNEFTNVNSGSLGSGLQVRDDSGSTTNRWFGGGKACFTETVINPGAGANIDIYPRLSTIGGVELTKFVVEWLAVTTNESAPAGTATVKLDVGGTSAGVGSDQTLTAVIAGTNTSVALPGSTEKVVRDGTNRHMFLNVTTNGSFSATADLVITWCATIL